MTTERIFVTFKPAYTKDACDLSRKLPAIESIIEAVKGSEIIMDPHDASAFRFLLPHSMDTRRADDVVLLLCGLQDDDGRYLLEAEQGCVGDQHNPSEALRQVYEART